MGHLIPHKCFTAGRYETEPGENSAGITHFQLTSERWVISEMRCCGRMWYIVLSEIFDEDFYETQLLLAYF